MSTEGAGSLIARAVRVYGLVQGVNYRRFTKEAADRLGLRGWVRNEADGSVSALIAHQSRAVLDRMLELMREGPWPAQVERLDSEPAEELSDLSGGFEILR
jgi:acylphosphatase